MGARVYQVIHECSRCGRVPEDGELMWYMGNEIWCKDCCEEAEDEELNDG